MPKMGTASRFAMARVHDVGSPCSKDGLRPSPMLSIRPKGLGMAYEWEPRRARRARIIRLATALAISASALTVPVAVLLAAAPI